MKEVVFKNVSLLYSFFELALFFVIIVLFLRIVEICGLSLGGIFPRKYLSYQRLIDRKVLQRGKEIVAHRCNKGQKSTKKND